MTQRQSIYARIRLILIAVLGAVAPVQAQTLADVLRDYEAAAFGASPALRARALGVDLARQDLAEARADGRPVVRLDTRITRAEGGRTIDLPLGDLLNPAYDALGQLTGGPFPTLSNTSIPLFRNESDARVRLTVPLYAPRVGPAVRLREALVGAETQAVEAARRDLVRDVRVAVLTLLQADRAAGILRASEALATETVRTAQALRRADRAIGADVLRAEADRFAAGRDRVSAERDRDLAAAALNVLVGRPPGAPVVLPNAQDAPPEAGPDDPDLPFIRVAASWRSSATTDSLAADSLASFQDAAVAQRQELARLDAVIDAREQAAALAQAAYRPTIGVSVEAGSQGSAGQGLFPDEPFVLASVGLSWELVDGGRRRAQRERARLEGLRDRALREDAALRVRLDVEQAFRAARVARAQIGASEARLTAAREGFRATATLVRVGSATQADTVDARTTLVSAELALNVDRFGLLIELARLDAALGTPAPPSR